MLLQTSYFGRAGLGWDILCVLVGWGTIGHLAQNTPKTDLGGSTNLYLKGAKPLVVLHYRVIQKDCEL